MKLSKFAFAALLAISTTCCWAGDESKIDLIYAPDAQANKQSSPAQPGEAQMHARASMCTVVINTPNDVRKNKDTLGTTFRDNPIISNQSPTVWLDTALLDLKGQGFNTVSGKAQGKPSTSRTVTISSDLNKLYIWNHSMNLHATLVVKARIRSSKGETVEKNYRVNSSKLNWANGDGEFVDTINLAVARLLTQIAEDLDGLCGSKIGA